MRDPLVDLAIKNKTPDMSGRLVKGYLQVLRIFARSMRTYRALGAQLKYVGCQVGVGIRGPGDHQLTQLCAISVSLNLPD